MTSRQKPAFLLRAASILHFQESLQINGGFLGLEIHMAPLQVLNAFIRLGFMVIQNGGLPLSQTMGCVQVATESTVEQAGY